MLRIVILNTKKMKYKNILQIDDDIDDCSFFSEALEEISDAQYTAIHNPLLALEKLISREICPDIIFLDFNMPAMNGIELLGEIKKAKVLLDIPIILFSTSITTEVKNKAENLGVLDSLIKPSDFCVLKKLLSHIV